MHKHMPLHIGPEGWVWILSIVCLLLALYIYKLLRSRAELRAEVRRLSAPGPTKHSVAVCGALINLTQERIRKEHRDLLRRLPEETISQEQAQASQSQADDSIRCLEEADRLIQRHCLSS